MLTSSLAAAARPPGFAELGGKMGVAAGKGAGTQWPTNGPSTGPALSSFFT